MNTTIATYYISELDSWKEAIDLHFEEMNESDEWLKEVIQFNTVPKLAAIVEHYLTLIMICRQHFDDLDDDILVLEKKLSEDNIPVEMGKLSDDLQKQHKALRDRMYKAEQHLLEVRYQSNTFLAETMQAQK